MLMMALLMFRPTPVIRTPPITKPTVAQVTTISTEFLAPTSSASVISQRPCRVSFRSTLMINVKTMA